MKLLANSKLLCALLAVVSVGMGAQTYYLIQVHRQLDATEERASEAAATSAVSEVEGEQPGALVPADPGTPLAPADPFADLTRAEERMRGLFDDFYDRFDREFGSPWIGGRPFFDDGGSFFLGHAGQLGPRVDLQDRGDVYELTVDLPGADEADVSVHVEATCSSSRGRARRRSRSPSPGASCDVNASSVASSGGSRCRRTQTARPCAPSSKTVC